MIHAEEVFNEKLRLEREVRELKEKLEFDGKLSFKNNVLWSDDPNDRGPYCNACWEGDKKAIHLHRLLAHDNYQCSRCKVEYDIGIPARDP